jgi:hypothetical protein
MGLGTASGDVFRYDLHKFNSMNGFGKEVVHAGVDAGTANLKGGVCGAGDDGDRVAGGEAAELAGALEAIHLRHLDIHKDEIEGCGIHGFDGGETAGGDADVVAFAFEDGPHEALGDFVVLDEENLGANGGGSRGLAMAEVGSGLREAERKRDG